MSKIIGTLTDDAVFSMSFPNGFDAGPEISITGFKIVSDNDSHPANLLEALSNYLKELAKKAEDGNVNIAH